MMHLSENNIQELAYAYVKRTRLSEKQVGLKRHMADCDNCFHKFLVERELQIALLGSGLVSDDAMEEILNGQKEQASEKILFRMKKAAEGLKMLIEDVKEKAGSLWDFSPVPQLAFSRGGVEEKDTEIYANPISEYSMIKVTEEGILVRLDEEDYQGETLALQVTRDGKTERISFVYNEEKETYDAFVSGKIEEGTQIEIIDLEK